MFPCQRSGKPNAPAEALANLKNEIKNKFHHVGSIEKLPFHSDSFDGILCSSVLEYVCDPGACIQEFGRVLRPRGVLLISVPNAWSIVRQALRLAHSSTRFFGQAWLEYL